MAGTVNYLTFLGGMKTALEALRLNQVLGFEAKPDATKAFDAVRIYAHESIAKAIEDARVFKDRLAFVVPTERRFDNEQDGRTLKTKQTVGCVLLLADRSYKDRSIATVGSVDTPGVIALSELVITELHGIDLGLPGVCLEPGDGQPFTLTSSEQEDLTGREVWAQEFTTSAGTLLTERARPGTTRLLRT